MISGISVIEKGSRKVDDIEIPKDVVPVEVPEDPALAINERYKVLGS